MGSWKIVAFVVVTSKIIRNGNRCSTHKLTEHFTKYMYAYGEHYMF